MARDLNPDELAAILAPPAEQAPAVRPPKPTPAPAPAEPPKRPIPAWMLDCQPSLAKWHTAAPRNPDRTPGTTRTRTARRPAPTSFVIPADAREVGLGGRRRDPEDPFALGERVGI